MSQADAPLHRAHPGVDLTEVERYYDDKTARIVEKYGPGPRIHFHTGLDARADAPIERCRDAMVESQEALVRHVTRDLVGSRVLDVGCGLGGASLFLASEGAAMTALTNVARHVPLVRKLAEIAGVRVEVVHGDAHRLEPLGRFDAAIAIESSCYLDRGRWFAELARVTARVLVVDCFIGRDSAARRFDGYWRTRIGSRRDYDACAEAAGFAPVRDENLGERVLAFWTLSAAWNEAAGRPERSTIEHRWLQRSIAQGDIVYASVVYERFRA